MILYIIGLSISPVRPICLPADFPDTEEFIIFRLFIYAWFYMTIYSSYSSKRLSKYYTKLTQSKRPRHLDKLTPKL